MEFNEIQGTDHHHQVTADLYFAFHWVPWSVPWLLENVRYRSLICILGLPEFLDLYIGFVCKLDMWNNINDLYLVGFSDFASHSSKLLGNTMLPEDIILQSRGLGFLGVNSFEQFLFDSIVCLMRTILRSKVLLPLGPCYFKCPA